MSSAAGWRTLLRGTANEWRAALADLDATLAAVAEVIPGATACSITERDAELYRTVAASAPVAARLDQVQYDHGDGPCLTAARDRSRQHVPDTAAASRFQTYAATAADCGVRSSLSIPITVADRPGSLNIYSARRDGFDARGCAVADLAGRVLTARLAEPSATPMTAAESAQVARRRELMRAAQAPALAAGATPDEAFRALVRRSSDERRSIFAVAADLVRGPEGPR